MKKIVLKHKEQDKYIHNCLGSKPTTTYSPKGAKGFSSNRGAEKYMEVHNIEGTYGIEMIVTDNE